MRNLKLLMAYNGSRYHGFQLQPNAATVQGTVEEALQRLLGGERVGIIGCSRTDAGVHAREFCFNLHTESGIPCPGLVKGMNALLPPDIAILSCEEVSESFHARYDCKGKEYVYLLQCGAARDVFRQGMALHYPYALDFGRMREVAGLLEGEHDFAAFCRAEAKAHLKSTVRRVDKIDISHEKDTVEIIVRGEGFLHNMVRIIAGTLLYVSEGKRSADDVQQALCTGDRARAGKTLPPDGLYLNKVFY